MYAITDPGAAPSADAGFEGAHLRAVRAGEVAAIVSDLEDRVEATESSLWEHERVVEELMGGGALLPMRFGSALADDAAVEAMLREREAELASGLAGVRGAVELGVRALWEAEDEAADELAPVASDEAEAPAGAGTTYLMRRLGRNRRTAALAGEIHAPLERLARASTQRVLTAPRLVVTGAYLVDEDRVDAFRDAVDELDAQIDGAAILCTGPWPPYSFAPAEAVR